MTRGNNMRPTRRLVGSSHGDEFVVEIGWNVIHIRPKGSRRGGRAEIALLPGALYVEGFTRQVTAEKRRKRGRGRGRAKR